MNNISYTARSTESSNVLSRGFDFVALWLQVEFLSTCIYINYGFLTRCVITCDHTQLPVTEKRKFQ